MMAGRIRVMASNPPAFLAQRLLAGAIRLTPRWFLVGSGACDVKLTESRCAALRHVVSVCIGTRSYPLCEGARPSPGFIYMYMHTVCVTFAVVDGRERLSTYSGGGSPRAKAHGMM
jgi:hypothetical protein